MKLTHLDTPALILQKDRLDSNIARLRAHLAPHGVALRPHMKTAKCVDVAKRVLAGNRPMITVSTLKEAAYFAAHGITDMLYAVAIVPAKMRQVVQLQQRGVQLSVILDSAAAARDLVAAADQHGGLALPVLIEIDCDGHRAGIAPGDKTLLEIAAILDNAPATQFAGVLAHAGSAYQCADIAAIKAMAAQERQMTLAAVENLERAGFASAMVSVGSTPTALLGEDYSGLSEVRAGVFMFFDLVMAGLGVCSINDIALSVLTSVIGHQAHKNQLLIDAGWMALSRDRGTASQTIDQGYGVVCDLSGVPIPDLIVTQTNQEHGVITSRSGNKIMLSDFPISSRLRILPNHACATAAQHQQYAVVTGDSDQVLETWQRFGGW